jgi:hypothetical protein
LPCQNLAITVHNFYNKMRFPNQVSEMAGILLVLLGYLYILNFRPLGRFIYADILQYVNANIMIKW